MRIETYRLNFSTRYYNFIFDDESNKKTDIIMCFYNNDPSKIIQSQSFYCKNGLTYKLSFASQVTSFHRVILYNLLTIRKPRF